MSVEIEGVTTPHLTTVYLVIGAGGAGMAFTDSLLSETEDAPDVIEWLERSRLNVARGSVLQMNEPRMQEAVARYFASVKPAVENIRRLLAAEPG